MTAAIAVDASSSRNELDFMMFISRSKDGLHAYHFTESTTEMVRPTCYPSLCRGNVLEKDLMNNSASAKAIALVNLSRLGGWLLLANRDDEWMIAQGQVQRIDIVGPANGFRPDRRIVSPDNRVSPAQV